jgi:hypothetical protein
MRIPSRVFAVAFLVLAGAAAADPQWLRGDLHVHDDHSADGSGPRQAVSQSAPGNVSIQDQITVGHLLSQLDFMVLTDHRTYDQHYDPLWESADLLLIAGEEANGRPHATVHGAVDSIVQGANPAGQPDFVNLQQSIWDAHAQDADWGTAHPDDGEMNDDDTPDVHANAIGPDLVEVWNRASSVDREMTYAEDRWNAGFRFGVAGASDDHFRETWAVAGPGMPVTQVLASARSERAILDGLRAGHTTLSAPANGPLVTLSADFEGSGHFATLGGDEVVAPAGRAGVLRVRVQNGGGDTVNIYRAPGLAAGVWKSFSPTPVETDASYDIPVTTTAAATWYRVEVRGVGLPPSYDISNAPISVLPAPQQLPDQLLALSSPIFVGLRLAVPAPDIALPADSGRTDGAQLALGARGQFTGFPDLAVDAGVAHLVAETHEPGATRIDYRRRTGDGTWSAPQRISGDSAVARFPKIAVRGADVWIAWQDERAGQQPRRPAIYLRHSADGGANFDAEQLVRAIGGRCEHPALVLDAQGVPVLAWQEISAGNPFDVMVTRLGDAAPVNVSRAGKTIAAASPVDTRSSRYPASVWPSLARAPDGRLALAWQDDRSDPDPLWTGATGTGDGTDPDNWQILVSTLAPGAQGWSVPVALGADDRADRHPSLAFSSRGALVVAWDSKALQSSGANLAVLWARSRDGGASWSAPAPIADAPAAMSQFPRLTTDTLGRVRAAWYDSRSSDWRWRVMTAVLGGASWSGVRLIRGPGNNTWPVPAGDALAFASTRRAQRLQRDRTQQVFLLSP